MKDLFSIGSKKKGTTSPSNKSSVSPSKSNSYENDECIQQTDIATRRRLSTPRTSPLPKRDHSQKNSNISSPPAKSNWFKSLERLSRKKVRIYIFTIHM